MCCSCCKICPTAFVWDPCWHICFWDLSLGSIIIAVQWEIWSCLNMHMTSIFHTCVAVESCMGTSPLHWHAHHTKQLCYCRKCKVAVVGFDGSPEVTSTKDLCLCGSNLLCVDVSKASPVALQSNARYFPCSYILIHAVTIYWSGWWSSTGDPQEAHQVLEVWSPSLYACDTCKAPV